MSFGDHLEELRTRLLRALVGVVVGIVLGLLLASPLLEVICRPVVTLLRANHLDPRLQALSPQEPFLAWMKVGLFAGLVLAAPYVIWEVWKFVALGLYEREQRIVRRMMLPSLVLFVVGVLFFFFIVLPLALRFFISFAGGLTIGEERPGAFMSWVIGAEEEPEPGENSPAPLRIPVLPGGPHEPQAGDAWFDPGRGELRVAAEEQVYTVALRPVRDQRIVQSQFRLQEYIVFVGMLSLSFGAAFQMPVVVIFLSWTGLVPTAQMAAARKYIIFGIVIAAAVLTPTPDVLNLALLAVPMVGLFEAGLAMAKWLERKREGRGGAATQ